MDIHALQGAGANNMMSKAKKRQKKVIQQNKKEKCGPSISTMAFFCN